MSPTLRNWAVGLFLFLPCWPVALTAGFAAEAAGSIRVIDSIVDPDGLNFPEGTYGSCINGQTFQQEALISFQGWQYAAYFREGGVLGLARRQLPRGGWQRIRFEDTGIRHTDVHNVAVLGICAADGTIHLAFDHHNSPLHYRRSVPGLALHPEQFTWSVDLFGTTTDALVEGEPLGGVTYPQFVSAPTGRLQLLFRQGSSGDGDWHLAEYGSAAQGWTRLGTLFSRAGEYETSRSRCAYPNPLRYGPDQRLHVTWCWRERPRNGPTDLRTNHDLAYAWSDDSGRSWKNNAGQVVAAIDGSQAGMSGSIHVKSPGIVVCPTRYLWGQMNTTTEFVDSGNRVHVIHWQHQQDAEAASVDLNTWRYYHYWRESGGSWQENRLPFVGRKPQIVLDREGNAFVVSGQGEDLNYHGQDPGGVLTVMMATAETQWRDWKPVWTSSLTHVGEPLLDVARWNAEHTLSIYTQERPLAPGKSSPLHVVDIEFQETR